MHRRSTEASGSPEHHLPDRIGRRNEASVDANKNLIKSFCQERSLALLSRLCGLGLDQQLQVVILV